MSDPSYLKSTLNRNIIRRRLLQLETCLIGLVWLYFMNYTCIIHDHLVTIERVVHLALEVRQPIYSHFRLNCKHFHSLATF